MTFFAYVLLTMAASEAAPALETPVPETRYAQLMIRQRVVIRIPARPPADPVPRPSRWREARGPKCVDLSAMAGAAIAEADSVDLILRGGGRMRARLDSQCPALDYYSGFYINPTADGRVCEGRDAIHTRAGGECGIDKFRMLMPEGEPRRRRFP